MKRWPIVLAIVVLVMLSVGSSPPKPETREIPTELKPIVDGNSKFALELFSRIGSQDGNLIASPFSVSSAMALAYGGARGNTENQIAQVCHFPTNQIELHSGMGAVLTSLTNCARGEELQVANGLWTQRSYQLRAEFTNLCQQNYHAAVELVDFKGGVESARQRINSWVGSQTKGQIRDLFAPGAVSRTTRMVIANAVYFKGSWASRFEKKNTHPMPFWILSEKAVQVPMMSQKSTFAYLVEGDMQVLELPYHGGRMSMLVLLPKLRDGLDKLELKLTLERLSQLVEALQPANVDLHLPRFKMSSSFSLNQTLSGMGMTDAFDEGAADFTGMTPQRLLFIQEIAHAAMVDVDEEGTVAAAGTGASFGCAKEPQPATFHADHPFVFIILDKSTRTLLFIGKVTNPSA